MGFGLVELLEQHGNCAFAPHAEHVPLLLRTASIATLAKPFACFGWQWRKSDASTTMVDLCPLGMCTCKDHLARSEPFAVAMAV